MIEKIITAWYSMQMSLIDLSRFDGIAFDVEGTLADTLTAHWTAQLAAFAHHQLGYITPEQHEAGGSHESTSDAIIAGVLRHAKLLPADADFTEHPLVRKIVATKEAHFAAKAALGFAEVTGGTAMVHDLARHLPGSVAIVTASTLPYIAPFLAQHSLHSAVHEELVITKETVWEAGLKNKPAPDPYHLAAKRLRASRLLVFEDSLPGIRAAKLAGATVVGINLTPAALARLPQSDTRPDYLAADYAAARCLLGFGV